MSIALHIFHTHRSRDYWHRSLAVSGSATRTADRITLEDGGAIFMVVVDDARRCPNLAGIRADTIELHEDDCGPDYPGELYAMIHHLLKGRQA